MEPIKNLEGKTVAIVGLGKSWFDYNLAKSHSDSFDEVWAINAVASVIFHDRVFMMDPASRFLETDDAGGQTNSMVKLLKEHKGPIYTCELDERCPGLVEYPVAEVIQHANCHYLNNTAAYAIAFALWNKVGSIQLFGLDFNYKGNLYFAESGRACCEFWLAKCMEAGIQIEIAHSSSLLDTSVPAEEKLYGYHRLDDPLVIGLSEDNILTPIKRSQLIQEEQKIEPKLFGRNDKSAMTKVEPVEPKKW